MDKDSEYERNWFDRLLEEKKELNQRIERITNFLDSDSINLMVPDELVLLRLQEICMKLYLSVLDIRINRNSW